MYKFAIALNKTLEPGVVLNTAAHISLGLVAAATDINKEQMKFISYIDANNIAHANISAWPLAILRGTNSELKKLRLSAQESELICIDFINTMTGGTYEEQLEKTKLVPTDELIYYGVGIFGPAEQVSLLTKKFSLWK